MALATCLVNVIGRSDGTWETTLAAYSTARSEMVSKTLTGLAYQKSQHIASLYAIMAAVSVVKDGSTITVLTRNNTLVSWMTKGKGSNPEVAALVQAIQSQCELRGITLTIERE